MTLDHIRNAMARGQTFDQGALKQMFSKSPFETSTPENSDFNSGGLQNPFTHHSVNQGFAGNTGFCMT